MRKRRIICAALAVTALGGTAALGGVIANAAEEDPRPATGRAVSETAAAGMLKLPTGDVVRMSPGGGISVEPAAGREDVGFVGQTALDGSDDVVVVPTDMLGAIRSGDEDPRRYNVSRLLAGGHTDAAAVPEAELDNRDYAGFVPAEERADASQAAQELSVSILDRSGGVPETSIVSWMKEGTDEFGDIEIGEDGTGTAALEPGDYLIMTLSSNAANETERGEGVYGFTPVTVGEEPAELVVDAAAAAPVSVEVERGDADLEEHLLYMEAGTELASAAAFAFLDAETDAYVLPQPGASHFTFNFLYQPRLTGPADAAEPYDYTLAFAEVGSLPADPAYSVTDAELSVQQTEFQDFGVEVEGHQCDYPLGWEEQIFFFGQCVKRSFPSQATILYNAAPILWDRTTEAGLFDAEGLLTDGFMSFESDVALSAGPSERVIGDGPLAAGVPWVERTEDSILGSLSPPASHTGETVVLVGYESTSVTLSRDGEELGSAENLGGEFGFELPEGDQGRYTLAAEATRGTATSPFAVESSLEWKFDSATVEHANLDLPVVTLDSETVQSGWADRGRPQEITLALASMEHTADSMGLEVSYDDGQTWTEAELDGDTATLEHPGDAEFVSLRLTATDSAGTEVTHTTTRSFGLR